MQQHVRHRTRSATKNARALESASTQQQQQAETATSGQRLGKPLAAVMQRNKRKLMTASHDALDALGGAAQRSSGRSRPEPKSEGMGGSVNLPSESDSGLQTRPANKRSRKGHALDEPLDNGTIPKSRQKPPAGAPSRDMEDGLRAQGYDNVAGVDEAGRGPLAGPVVVAACVVPEGVDVPGVRDSKQMSEEERDRVYEHIKADPRIKWAVSIIGHEQIDRENILQATLTGMRQALHSLAGITEDVQADHPADSITHYAAAQASGGGHCDVHFALVDGNKLPKDLPCPAQAVVKGDGRCVCIAAASIMAKVTRDRIMHEYHEKYPQYGFDLHKAYGVPAHMKAIHHHGPCPIHRRSFEPVKSLTGWSREPAAVKRQRPSTAAKPPPL